ncbi:MAG: aminoglycoside phosphotransferase family protein [Candidatus Nanohalobium sp.]
MDPEKVESFLDKNRDVLGRDFELEERKTGESNHNFIIEAEEERYVLRVSRQVSRRSRLREEAEALDFLEEQEVEHVPRLEWFGETEIGAVLIETFVGEENIQKGDFDEEELRRSAELLADIHKISTEEYNDFFGTQKEQKASLRKIYAREYRKWSERPYNEYLDAAEEPDERLKEAYRRQEKLFKTVPDIEVPQRPVHGDLGFNVRKSGEKVFFVDWEYFTTGFPGHDVVYFFEHEGLDEEEREVFLEEYRRHRELDKAFEENRERYRKFLAFNDMIWAAKRLETGEGDQEKMQEIFDEKMELLEKLHEGLSG